jgi:2-alkyl-3-oxoalkanoate reductase
MKQAVLVLGASGFIGRRVVAGLAATDWAQPIAAVRRHSAQPAIAGEQRVVEATSSASIGEALAGVGAVVNCVATDPGKIVPVTRALLEAVAKSAPGIRVAHLSTMAVYGSSVGLLDETASLKGDQGDYSAAKVAAEAVAAEHPRTVIFRPGIVYGPESSQWSARIAEYLLARRLGDLGAAGDGYCNLVHVDDVAAAIVSALRNSAVDGHVFNLANPALPTWNEYLIRYARALRAVPVRRISHRRLKAETKLLAAPLKIAEILARKARLKVSWLPPAIPPSLLRLMQQDIQLDSRRATGELAMQWRDLDAGLGETAAWFLNSRAAA